MSTTHAAQNFISSSDAAIYLGISKSTFFRFEKNGLINATQNTGYKKLYSLEHIKTLKKSLIEQEELRQAEIVKKRTEGSYLYNLHEKSHAVSSLIDTNSTGRSTNENAQATNTRKELKQFLNLRIKNPKISSGGINAKKKLSGIHAKLLKSRRTTLPFVLGVLIILVPVIYLSLKNPKEARAAWYNNEWDFRIKLSVDNTKVSGSADHTDFPVLVSIRDNNLAQLAQSDGDDILFTSEDGKTKLSHEIESFNSTTGELIAWVKVPTLKFNSDTHFYLYYGNATASSQQDTTGTWHSDYKIVMHLSDVPTGSADDINDSTNNNEGTSQGSMNSSDQVPGQIGGSLDFADGGSQYINVTHNSTVDIGENESITVSFWFKAPNTTNSEDNDFISKGGAPGWRFKRTNPSGSNNHMFFQVRDGTTNRTANVEPIQVNDGQWHYVVGVKNNSGNYTKIYWDGAEAGTATNLTTSMSNTTDLRIARDALMSLDEFRLNRSPLSGDWIATEYNNQKNPATFFSNIGNVETKADPVLIWSFDEGTGTTTYDNSGYRNNGTITNAVWVSEDRCIYGKCLSFDGTGDYVSMADNADVDFAATENFTIQAWVKHPPISTNADIIIDKYETTGSDGGYSLSMQADGTLRFAIDDNNTSPPSDHATSTARYDDNRWHLVTGVKTGTSKIELFVDGVLVGSDSSIQGTGTLENNDTFYVGRSNVSTSFDWHGFIDEVKVYPYARSDAEVKSDYLRGAATAGSAAAFGLEPNAFLNENLMAYFPMDESTANTCAGGTNDSCDASLNSHDGAWQDGATAAAGRYGKGVTFDGSGDYIQLSNSSTLDYGTGDITYSIWVKSTQDCTGNKVYMGQRDNNPNIWLGCTRSGGIDRAAVQFDSSTEDMTTLVGTKEITDGNWHHLAAIKEGHSPASIKVYVDGILDASTTMSYTGNFDFAQSTGAQIGRFNASPFYYTNGTLDEARIYNKALTATEVEALYNWAPGPALYYDFNENTGTSSVSDKSGYGMNGTMQGSMTAADWVTGRYGSALRFDGSDDRIESADTTVSFNDYTTSSWFKTKGTGTIAIFSISDDEYSATAQPTLILSYLNNGNATCGFRHTNGGSFFSVASDSTYNDGEWHHAVCKRTGAELSVCVDGICKTETEDSTQIAFTSDKYVVGRGWNGSGGWTWHFPGSIDDVKLYSYARSTKQIIEDMNAGHPAGGSPIGSQVSYWAFDEMYGDTAYDSVGSSNGDLAGSGTTCPTTGACPTWSANGKVNNTLDFDGSDDYVRAGSAFNPGNTDFTISGWIRPEATNNENSDSRTVFSQQNGTGTGRSWIQLDAGTTQWRTFLGGSQKNSGVTIDVNQWSHVSLIHDNTADTLTWYVNGIKGTTHTSVGVESATGDFIIGANKATTGGRYDGQIDELKLYTSALTEEQIRIDMNSGSGINVAAFSDERNDISGGAPASPIAYWDFNENTGTTTVYDKSENSHNGAMDGSMTAEDWVRGKYGSGLEFDGSNDHIDVASSATFDAMSTMTLSMWAKASDVSQTSEYGLFAIQKSGTDKAYLFFDDDSSGIDVHNDIADASTDVASTNFIPTKDQWFHVTWVINGTEWKTYINGIERGSTTLSTTLANMADGFTLVIGARATGGTSSWKGVIDDVKLYNYARTPAQIAYDYNRGAPIGWWQFDECSGGTAYNNGTDTTNGTITIGGSGSNTSTGTCGSGTGSQTWNNGTTGKYNASLDFDGNDDFVSMGDPASGIYDFGANQDFSVMAWVKTTQSATSGAWPQVVGKEGGSPRYGYLINLHNGATPGWFAQVYQNGSNYNTSGTTINVADGQWHHLTLIRNGSTLYAYTDGVLTNSVSVSTGDISNTQNLQVGSDTWSGSEYDGQIDDVRIYNYAVSESQLKKIVNEGSVVRFGPNN